MSSFCDIVPPGFRFHPTEEELVDYYLRKRVASIRIDLDVIKDVDLYRIEPWDLQELCNMGMEDQSDYYFFSHKDKKYPTGTRTNRATKEGFWKATGRDKPIYVMHRLIGMRKTLVYYKGRAPNGQKLDWIMHEYRLETDENAPPQEEGWVVCRMFKKRMVSTTNMRKDGDHNIHPHESPCWYDEQQASFMHDMDSPMQMLSSPPYHASNNQDLYFPSSYPCKEEEQLAGNGLQYIQPDQVDSSIHNLPQVLQGVQHGNYFDQRQEMGQNVMYGNSSNSFSNDVQQEMGSGWRVLDRFVASQLSHGDAGDKQNYLSSGATFEADQGY